MKHAYMIPLVNAFMLLEYFCLEQQHMLQGFLPSMTLNPWLKVKDRYGYSPIFMMQQPNVWKVRNENNLCKAP